MHRLLALKEKQRKGENEIHIISFLAAVSDALATILLSDKTKLEKASHNQSATGTSRSVLCRAILTSTMACHYIIRDYVPTQRTSQKQHKVSWKVFEVAVATLDRLVHLKGSTPNNNGSNNSGGEGGSQNELDTVGAWNIVELASDCNHVQDVLDSVIKPEKNCVEVLLGAMNSTASEETESARKPPAKRSRRGTGNKSSPAPATTSNSTSSLESFDPNPIVIAFEKLCDSEKLGTRIDGRVAIKRFASVAIVWSGQLSGQVELLSSVHQLAESNNQITATQKSLVMSQLICTISDISNHCGSRPASGGIDNYLKTISLTETSASPTKQKSKAHRRVDIREWGMVVIYDLIQVHKMCLEEARESASDFSPGVVNEGLNDRDGGQQNSTSENFVAPQLKTAIESLCRSASSSVPNSSYTEQASWNKAMTSIAAAYVMQLISDPTLPLDCNLASFSLSHLSECIQRLDNQPTTSSAGGSRVVDAYGREMSEAGSDQNINFENKYSLNEPLPKPFITETDSGTVASGSCTFGGTLTGNESSSYSADSFSDEQALAIAIRSLPEGKDHHKPPASKLWSFFIDLVRRSYDTRRPKENDCQDEEEEDRQASGSKRKLNARNTPPRNRRGGRRRKLDEGEKETPVDEGNFVWDRITTGRASVSADALSSLRALFTKGKRLSNSFRHMIRASVTKDHLINILKLGEMLDKVLIKTRVGCAETISGFESNFDFAHYEKQLWSSHIKLCQVLGRGDASYDPNGRMDAIIWDQSKRIAVYDSIAGYNSPRFADASLTWPISLPATHLAFLVANMSCTMMIHGDKSAEKKVVGGYVDSITKLLLKLDVIQPSPQGEQQDRWIDDEIPLSYDDAQTLLLALYHCSIDERRYYLEKLVGATSDALHTIVQDQDKTKNGEVMGFVSRVLVVCYSLANSIQFGRQPLQQSLLSRMGCHQWNLPTFVSSGTWHRQGTTFLGLYGSWNSPALPEEIGERNTSLLGKKLLDNMTQLFKTAFSVGFESSNFDHFYLLFVAWNGLDQIPPRDQKDNIEQNISSSSLPKSPEDYSNKILQLRDDVCALYGDNSMSSDRLKAYLHSTITKANMLVDHLYRCMFQTIPKWWKKFLFL